jgi:hypothetical protein
VHQEEREEIFEDCVEEMPFEESQEGKILKEPQQEETSDEDQNKNINRSYETRGSGKELKKIRVRKVAKGESVKDIKGNIGKSQDGVTNEKLSQQTSLKGADNLLSIHQTINNTQEVTSTMEESLREMTGVLKQMMISSQEVMLKLNQLEENFKRMEKEDQEMKKVIQEMKEKMENQSEMKK